MNSETKIETKEYPSLLLRVKGAFADVIVMIIFMYGASEFFLLFEEVSESIRMSAFIFIFVLYDPLFISLFGGTIGHNFIGLKVKQESNELKNISFPSALLRFIIKSTLGWISFLTMGGNKKKKAIHDIAVNSVVIYE